jgi:hypothetical protein
MRSTPVIHPPLDERQRARIAEAPTRFVSINAMPLLYRDLLNGDDRAGKNPHDTTRLVPTNQLADGRPAPSGRGRGQSPIPPVSVMVPRPPVQGPHAPVGRRVSDVPAI